jgi:L-2-hydroxyglutarate oxidase LhgO
VPPASVDVRLVDVLVVGGGIVGLATALALLELRPGASLVVLEKEANVASHQTGHNSGVIHAGVYYKPGSLKATLCTQGRRMLERFCEEHDVPFERCGKVILATSAAQLPQLDELERRARANGVEGVVRLSAEEVREREPHAAGVAGLFVAATGVADYRAVASAYATELRRRGADIVTGARAAAIALRGDRVTVESTHGVFEARALVACAGLESDRIARMAGLEPDVAIVPFRGEYWMLAPERSHLVRNLIYPVPDPAFPFLGVHFTRRIAAPGNGLRRIIEAGPNAVLALAREGYTRASFHPRDAWDIARWPGFWRMARKHWRAGLHEQARSLSRTAFARACAELVPEVGADDLVAGGAGVRAQAVGRDGALIDDFALVEGPRMVHVLNAPSPAATASLAIGRHVAERAARWV